MREDIIVTVIGATGQLGRKLVARLFAHGVPVIAVGRSEARLASLPVAGRRADLTDCRALGAALGDARRVVSCAHARFAPAILETLPDHIERVVFTGSTRRFTRFADPVTEQLASAEAALLRSGRPGVMIHPTMIYGADGRNNVRRIATYVRRFGVVPLPRGGRMLVQPIHVEDVAACLEAALFRPEALGPPLVVAGPKPVSYRVFVEAIAHAMDRRVRIVTVPAGILMAAAVATPLLPGLPRITAAEVRRLREDKAFDIAEMRRRLGVEPIDLAAGLQRTFIKSSPS